jgi:threonine/homoserine efflux transporter RhtA
VLYPTRSSHAAAYAVVVVAQMLDLASFVPAVARVGIGAESNPFARTLYQTAGPLGPAALKATVVAIMLLALVRVARRFPARLVASAAILTGIGLAGAASNLLFGLLR